MLLLLLVGGLSGPVPAAGGGHPGRDRRPARRVLEGDPERAAILEREREDEELLLILGVARDRRGL